MMIRLLALDMDGTLLDSRKQIPPGSIRALTDAHNRGLEIVLSTGRGLAELAGYLPQLPFVRYGVLESGALLYDFADQRPLELLPLDPEAVLSCLDLCEEADAMPHFLTVDGSVVNGLQLRHMADYGHGDFQSLFEAVCERVDDMRAYAEAHSGTILKICMYHRAKRDRERSLERLRGLPLDFRFSENHSLEATARGADKGAGLSRLVKRLGIPLRETAACGDADNDLDMLACCGSSFAMGNAPAHVRAAAGRTVRDNDHGGVEEAVGIILAENGSL